MNNIENALESAADYIEENGGGGAPNIIEAYGTMTNNVTIASGSTAILTFAQSGDWFDLNTGDPIYMPENDFKIVENILFGDYSTPKYISICGWESSLNAVNVLVRNDSGQSITINANEASVTCKFVKF